MYKKVINKEKTTKGEHYEPRTLQPTSQTEFKN